MKIGLHLPLLIVSAFATFGWSQTTTSPAPPAASPAAPAATIKPRSSPEAVAAQDPNHVVATINGQKITAKQVADMLKPFPPEQRSKIDGNLQNAVQQIYMQQQLADAARQLKLEEKSPYKEQLRLSEQGILARAYVTHLSDEAAKEPSEDPQKYYDAHKAEFDNAKLSGIFVPFNPPGTPANNSTPNALTEEQARSKADDLEKKLAAGGDFAALARSESVHPTASKGGDLGTVPINDPSVGIPAEVKAAVAKLQPGQVSEPVRVPGAFLIVKLESRETTSFDKAKAGIETKLQTERSQGVIKKETEKYTIHVEDQDFFGSSAATASAAGPKIPSLQKVAPAPPAPATQPKP